jgi:hypothetical protein
MPDRPPHRKERVRETRAGYRPRRGLQSGAETAEWRWIQANRERLQEQYEGRWIAVVGERVVGAGINLATALRQAKKKGLSEPFVTAFKKAEHRGTTEVAHWL